MEKQVYPLPTTEDLFAHKTGGQVFSKLDMSQLILDEDSKKVLEVNTPRGLFRYIRLPYRVPTTPTILQSRMDWILQGLPVVCYLDDTLVAAKTEEEYDKLLEQTLERLENAGIKLRWEICEFYTEELQYLGHCINFTGIHPTEEKCRPSNKHPYQKM